ncbi:hypothetical protein PI125_g15082 [Phytophthora idaei]|nr:hypothetical protein PI125_g15082 [Phytophthora idaei]
MESVCVLEYEEGASGRRRTFELASPPRDARSITRLPGLSWKNFLRALKDAELEQICLVTDADSASSEVNAVSVDSSSRPKSVEPKSAREERFAAQSWEALRESGNPVYETAREYADVFPDKIPAELPADRGIRHKIDLVPGSKYCSGCCCEIWSKPLTSSSRVTARRVANRSCLPQAKRCYHPRPDADSSEGHGARRHVG